MKNLFTTIGLSALAMLLMFGCKKNGVDPNEDCGKFGFDDLRLEIQESYTTLPGKVSIFFKVDSKTGTPVSKLYPEDFTIYEKGRNDACPKVISSNESFARVAPSSQIFVYNTMLVLDLSGSVIGNSLTELKEASKSFIENVMTGGGPDNPDGSFKMGIWWFDGEDELHKLVGFTNDKSVLKSTIDGITPEISTDPSTDLYGAVIKATQVAYDRLEEYRQNDILAASSIVLFTDGTDQAARHSYAEALSTVNSASASVKYFTIGLGDEIDEDVLTSLGRNGTIFATNKEELEETFRETADLVWAEANSFYLFEYCSPKRDGSGISEVTIVADSDGQKGFIKSSFDATGFTSGCN